MEGTCANYAEGELIADFETFPPTAHLLYIEWNNLYVSSLKTSFACVGDKVSYESDPQKCAIYYYI